MILYSWNVNGVRAACKKGFDSFFTGCDFDIFALQEIKCLPQEFPSCLKKEYFYINSAQKKGYSGTAVITKKEPISVVKGIPDFDSEDLEGRVLTLEFENFYFVTSYVPNSQEELKRLSYRRSWNSSFAQYLSSLDKIKPVIVCGDLNVAHEEIDLKNPKNNHFNPGFSDEERQDFSTLLSLGFTDTFRKLYPKSIQYSWFSYRFKAREKNIGWRIDYFLVSNRLLKNVEDSLILNGDDLVCSDHLPIKLLLNY